MDTKLLLLTALISVIAVFSHVNAPERVPNRDQPHR
jgi:hypothetical protein